MGKKIENDFMPGVAIPPGITLKENIEYLGMSQTEFALRIGVSSKHLSEIVNGIAPLTYDTAMKLEKMFGAKAEFWMNLEASYQLDKARIQEEKELLQELEILKHIPYNEMSKFGWIKPEKDKKLRVINSRKFYRVSSLGLVCNTYAVKFRRVQTKNEISDYGVIGWLRKAEIEGEKSPVAEFDKYKLQSLIPMFRSLTLESPDVFYPKMKKLCAECGVALVLVESLPRTYINGATIWHNNKAILALSVRGRKADIFWFTFFHELAHILQHRKNHSHISIQDDRNKEEIEADELASNFLISNDHYDVFKTTMNYESINDINMYAKNIGIAPHILIGRLLHDKLIDFRYFNKYRPSFEIVRG